MKPEDRYLRFVRWSDEDQSYIGYFPDLHAVGVCHGEITHCRAKGEKLPEPAVRAMRDLDFAA